MSEYAILPAYDDKKGHCGVHARWHGGAKLPLRRLRLRERGARLEHPVHPESGRADAAVRRDCRAGRPRRRHHRLPRLHGRPCGTGGRAHPRRLHRLPAQRDAEPRAAQLPHPQRRRRHRTRSRALPPVARQLPRRRVRRDAPPVALVDAARARLPAPARRCGAPSETAATRRHARRRPKGPAASGRRHGCDGLCRRARRR